MKGGREKLGADQFGFTRDLAAMRNTMPKKPNAQETAGLDIGQSQREVGTVAFRP